jgi:hypothetical protein
VMCTDYDGECDDCLTAVDGRPVTHQNLPNQPSYPRRNHFKPSTPRDARCTLSSELRPPCLRAPVFRVFGLVVFLNVTFFEVWVKQDLGTWLFTEEFLPLHSFKRLFREE